MARVRLQSCTCLLASIDAIRTFWIHNSVARITFGSSLNSREQCVPSQATCNNLLIFLGSVSGKQRYRCLVCKTTRMYHGKKKSSQERLRQLFKQYVLWDITYEMLTSLSGFSVAYLRLIL